MSSVVKKIKPQRTLRKTHKVHGGSCRCSGISVFYCFTVYDPANGVRKMPTASSNQIRRNAARITTMIAIRYPVLFTFLIINSHRRPVPSSKTPATTKSESFQFTSSVNCIAINGMSNRNITVSTMPISLLFFIIINFLSHPPGILPRSNYIIIT